MSPPARGSSELTRARTDAVTRIFLVVPVNRAEHGTGRGDA